MTLFDQPQPAGPRRVTLVRLSAEIARATGTIGSIVVEGEVHRPSRRSGGAWFTLRDRAAQLQVRVPGSKLRRCRTVDGERVAVTGALEYTPNRGQLQLVADEVVPVGAGAVAAMLTDIRTRLAHDGLLDRARRPLPRLPRMIGVVCGADAAVRRDIESVISSRFPGYPVEFVETNVSGSGAADAIVRSLEMLDERDDVDVIVLARGGGDATHLLPFSDEDLCRAICAARKPVVSAIGHEGDRPLCDEVADARFGTPSLAASAVVPSYVELRSELDAWHERGLRIFQQRIDLAVARLDRLDRTSALEAGLQRATQRLERAASRIEVAHPRVRLDRAEAHLGAARQRMDALDPARVLARGYAVVRDREGTVVRRADQVRRGDPVSLQLAVGTLAATVDSEEDL